LANQLAKNGAKSKWPRFSLAFFGVRLRVSRRRRLEHSDVHKNVNAAATTTSANALEPQPHENMPLGLNCQSGWVGLDWPGLAGSWVWSQNWTPGQRGSMQSVPESVVNTKVCLP